MSTYYLESKDKSIINFTSYLLCTDARRNAQRLARESNIPILVYKSLKYPPSRESAFLRCTCYPDGKFEFEESDIDKLIDQILDNINPII